MGEKKVTVENANGRLTAEEIAERQAEAARYMAEDLSVREKVAARRDLQMYLDKLKAMLSAAEADRTYSKAQVTHLLSIVGEAELWLRGSPEASSTECMARMDLVAGAFQ